MIIAADEIARSLSATIDLLQRRRQGLHLFDASRKGVRRSFFAFLLLSPAFVTMLAAERASHGLLVPGGWLFDDFGLTVDVLERMAICMLTLPLIVFGLARSLSLRDRYPRFLVACNWSTVLAGSFMALPCYLFALDMATPELAQFYGFAFAALFAHLRWFVVQTALGVSGGIAALAVGCDLTCEFLLSQLI